MATGVSQRRYPETAHPRGLEKKAKSEAKGKVGGFSVTMHKALDKIGDGFASLANVFRTKIGSLHSQESRLLSKINNPTTDKATKKELEVKLRNVQGQIVEIKKTNDGVKTIENKLHGVQKTLDQVVNKLERFKVENVITRDGERVTRFVIDDQALKELSKMKQLVHGLKADTEKQIKQHPDWALKLFRIDEKIIEAELQLAKHQLVLKRAQLNEKLESPRGTDERKEIAGELLFVEKSLRNIDSKLKPITAKWSDKFHQRIVLQKEIQRLQNFDPIKQPHLRAELNRARNDLLIVNKEFETLDKELREEFARP